MKTQTWFVGSVLMVLFIAFIPYPTAYAQSQTELNVTGEINLLDPDDSAVALGVWGVHEYVDAVVTNHESFLIAMGVRAKVCRWDDKKRKWVATGVESELVDVKAALPGETVSLSDFRTLRGLPQGDYRIQAELKAWFYNRSGQIVRLTPIVSETHFFIVQ